ncbi:hypothetical protein ABLE91_15775 [Aquabacter sp. CN5-332]|uniref:hypothetical protein n=1 Tax=Aquabacter sp. CN5-332 TaxID=3156608 RepID=UPI0032B45CAA
MVKPSPAGKTSRKPELVVFIEQISGLISEDRYTDAGEAIAKFAKEHPTLLFFVDEALPARVSDHLLKKTNAHSAFTTYTLRHPNWATELTKSATDPEAFAGLVQSIEAGIREIAGTKKAA